MFDGFAKADYLRRIHHDEGVTDKKSWAGSSGNVAPSSLDLFCSVFDAEQRCFNILDSLIDLGLPRGRNCPCCVEVVAVVAECSTPGLLYQFQSRHCPSHLFMRPAYLPTLFACTYCNRKVTFVVAFPSDKVTMQDVLSFRDEIFPNQDGPNRSSRQSP